MRLRICVSILPRNERQLYRSLMDGIKRDPDLIEVRLDRIRDVDLAKISKLSSVPLIATNRSRSQGGYFEGDEEQRSNILKEAARRDFDFIDVELNSARLRSLIEEIRSLGARIVLSSHNLRTTPPLAQIQRIFERELTFKPEIHKVVTMARSWRDNLTLLKFVSEASERSKTVSFAMGRLGRISRLLSPFFGAYFTFASLGSTALTAPGQIGIDELRRAWSSMRLV